MPTRKGDDREYGFFGLKHCRHPDHSPPNHMAYSPGLWEHECPSCGSTTSFVVDKPTWIEAR